MQADQHFIVWMRTAALRNFRKLWGRIEQDIPAGATLTVLVQNRSMRMPFSSMFCSPGHCRGWSGPPQHAPAQFAVGLRLEEGR